MSILLNALWLLCGLSAVTFAALAGRSWAGRAAVASGFVAALAVIPGYVALQVETAAGMCAIGAAVMLVRPRYERVTAFLGGALAAILGLLLASQGVPMAASIVGVAFLAVIPLVLAAKDARFVDRAMRDEALLGICIAGLAIALTPGIQEGWRSAAVLNVAGNGAGPAQLMLPGWTLAVAATSVILGGAHYVWRRQR